MKLLRSFYRDFSDANSQLAGHLENGRRGEARRLVHSVKGVAGNIGATGLSALAAILEGILVTDTPDPSSPARVDFEQAMDQVIEGLGVHLGAETPGDKGEGPTAAQPALPTLTAAMLLELADLFDEDFASAGSRIEELHPALRALAGEADWARLQEHLEGFEIDEVIDLLRQLAASL
jgi:HPt (histidine-containing phosphotransfer) domain-containing protein